MKIFKYNKDLTREFDITSKSLRKGTFWVIYFGMDLEFKKPIAIKCIRKEKEKLNNISNEIKEEAFFQKCFILNLIKGIK